MRPDDTPTYAIEDRGYETPCWIWQGSVGANGYGTTRDDDGRRRSAHVVSFERRHGPVPKGLELDHLCRQRPCINPDHMEPVGHAENIRRSSNTPLTWETVREIRALHGKASGAELAKRYGITAGAVSAIQQNHRWTDPDYVPAKLPVSFGKAPKLTEDDVREIRRLRGVEPQPALAVRFGVDRATISAIQTGRNWKTVA